MTIKDTSWIREHIWSIATAATTILSGAFQLLWLKPNLVDLHAFRQTQTAFTIREFMAGNWSIDTPLPTLGPPWSIPYEFPLFQGFAAVLGDLLGFSADSAGRIAGLIFFLVSGVLLALLIRRWFGQAASILTLMLYQLTPFAAQWAASSLIEFAAVAFTLASIVTIDSFRRSSKWWLIFVSTLLLMCAFVIKPTTALPWMIVFLVASSGIVWRSTRAIRFTLLGLIPIGVSALLGLGWTAYADSIKEQNPIGKYLTSEALQQWNFGTIGQRMTFEQWDRIIERLPSLGASLIILFVLLGFAFWQVRQKYPLLALSSVPVLAVITFFNLYVVHSYYLSAIYPAYVAIVAVGIWSVSNLIPRTWMKWSVNSVILVLLLVMAWTSIEGRTYALSRTETRSLPPISEAIAAATQPGDGVIVAGCDWDPTPLFYAERPGMTLPNWYRDGVPPDWIGVELKFLVFCNSNYEVAQGNPQSVLPDGTLFTEVAPGIYRIVAPAAWFERTYRTASG